MVRSEWHGLNINARIDIDINTKQLNIFKQYGINGRFKENKHFNRLIRIRLRRFEKGDFYTFRDLHVKVRSIKPITFINAD